MIPSTPWLDVVGIEKEGRLKSVESLPTNLQASVLLPLKMITNVYGNPFTLEWKGIESLPTEISCTLIDYITGEQIDLRTNDTYEFTLNQFKSSQYIDGSYIGGRNDDKTFETASSYSEWRNSPIIPHVQSQAIDTSSEHRFALLLQNKNEITINTESRELQATVKNSVIRLDPNYPNPFNPNTSIYYEVRKPTFLQLKVFDSLGRLVTVLQKGFHQVGEYRTQWNANGEASGIFYLQLSSQDEVLTQKMLFLK